MSIHTRIVCRNCKQVLMHCQCDKPSVTEQKAFVETRNPMTTTAEEYIIDKLRARDVWHGINDRVIIIGYCNESEAREYARLYHSEKLREAEEVSDVSDEEIENIIVEFHAETKPKDTIERTADQMSYFDGGMRTMARILRSKLSPKIAAMKEKYSLLFEENAGQYLDLHQAKNTIAQLQAEKEVLKEELSGGIHSCPPNCQNPTCIIRRERDQLQAEKERMAKALKALLAANPRGVDKHITDEALASLPEDSKDVGVKVGDYIKGSWRDPATGKTYFAEGTVRQFDAGLFVQEGDDGGITNLELFFNFSVINRTELPEEGKTND